MSSAFFTISGLLLTSIGIVLYLVGQASVEPTDIVAGFPTLSRGNSEYLILIVSGVFLGFGTTALINALYQIRRTPRRWRILASIVLGFAFLAWGMWRVVGHDFLPVTRFGLFWYGASAGGLLLLAAIAYAVSGLAHRGKTIEPGAPGQTPPSSP